MNEIKHYEMDSREADNRITDDIFCVATPSSESLCRELELLSSARFDQYGGNFPIELSTRYFIYEGGLRSGKTARFRESIDHLARIEAKQRGGMA